MPGVQIKWPFSMLTSFWSFCYLSLRVLGWFEQMGNLRVSVSYDEEFHVERCQISHNLPNGHRASIAVFRLRRGHPPASAPFGCRTGLYSRTDAALSRFDPDYLVCERRGRHENHRCGSRRARPKRYARQFNTPDHEGERDGGLDELDGRRPQRLRLRCRCCRIWCDAAGYNSAGW